MFTVPATRAAVAAIRDPVRSGINVNATLLVSVARCLEVADANRAHGEPAAR